MFQAKMKFKTFLWGHVFTHGLDILTLKFPNISRRCKISARSGGLMEVECRLIFQFVRGFSSVYSSVGRLSPTPILSLSITMCRQIQAFKISLHGTVKKVKINDVRSTERTWYIKPILCGLFCFLLVLTYQFFYFNCLRVSFLFYSPFYSCLFIL